jgi:hypothetical protein
MFHMELWDYAVQVQYYYEFIVSSVKENAQQLQTGWRVSSVSG